LKRFEVFDAVGVNWLINGSNSDAKREDGVVLERFPRHAHRNAGNNRRAKAIVNPRIVVRVSIHTARSRQKGRVVDVLGHWIDDNRSAGSPIHQLFRLNHYSKKLAGEIAVKRPRLLATYFNPNHEEELRNRLVEDFRLIHDMIQE
jgi:hypothetical protein